MVRMVRYNDELPKGGAGRLCDHPRLKLGALVKSIKWRNISTIKETYIFGTTCLWLLTVIPWLDFPPQPLGSCACALMRWKENLLRLESDAREAVWGASKSSIARVHSFGGFEHHFQAGVTSVFPESVWAKGCSNSGGLSNMFTSSHLHILTSSHLLILTSLHPHIFTSSHLHIFSSSHLLTFTSSHLHIFSSSHLHIFSSSHPYIFTSILSCPLALLPSCSLALLLSWPLLFPSFYSYLKARGSANETARNATFSHETRFDRQKM